MSMGSSAVTAVLTPRISQSEDRNAPLGSETVGWKFQRTRPKDDRAASCERHVTGAGG